MIFSKRPRTPPKQTPVSVVVLYTYCVGSALFLNSPFHSEFFWQVRLAISTFPIEIIWPIKTHIHTGQCKSTCGCYNELVVAFYSTGGGVKGKKIYTCWLYYLFINLHLFYLWWHLAHRPPVTLQFMALPSNWWFNSWFGLQIQQSSGVLSWQVFFSSVTA